MVFYHKLGKIPHKRHTAFRKEDGGIYQEHLMGYGFHGLKSLLYTLRPPTQLKGVEHIKDIRWEPDPDPTLHLRHLRAHRLPAAGTSPILDRTPLLFNDDVGISLARPSADDDFFYRNGQETRSFSLLWAREYSNRKWVNLTFDKGIIWSFPKA